MFSRYISVTLLCAAAVAGLNAQETLKDTVKLGEVIVTAPAKVNPALLPLDVTQISEEQINETAETSLLPVLVNKVAGVFVTERGMAGYGVSGGSAGTVNIRGVGQGNKVLFMIDGQPQWAGVFGHSLADTYVANGVERIEVVKGPSSILYGSNAMGGSINIITRHQKKEGVSGRARGMFGSYNTQKFDMSTGVRKGKFDVTAAGQLDRSNGSRAGSEFWLANEFIQLRYVPSSHWSVGTNLDMTQTKANNPGTLQSPLENMWTKVFRGTASLYAKNSYDGINGGLQAYINWGRNKVDDGNAPGSAPRDYLFNSTDYNMGITVYQSVDLWRGNSVHGGIDFQHWGGHNWNIAKADPSVRSAEFRGHENEIAGYVMMQQNLLGEILNLNGGVRLQHGSSYGNVWVPQAGIMVTPVKNSQFKLSFSKGFRSPNLRELYLYAPANPDLKPEYMRNYELSYRQTALNGGLSLGVALFFIDGSNMIETRMIDGRPCNMNTGGFINKGFEIDGAWRIDRRWTASANYSYLHTDARVMYAPKNKLNAEVTFTPGAFSFTLSESSIWSLYNGAEDNLTVNYTLLDLRAAYTFGAKVPVTALVKVDNLTNRKYEIVYGCPMPGTTVMGGIEFKF